MMIMIIITMITMIIFMKIMILISCRMRVRRLKLEMLFVTFRQTRLLSLWRLMMREF